jgi:hypothetical protein
MATNPSAAAIAARIRANAHNDPQSIFAKIKSESVDLIAEQLASKFPRIVSDDALLNATVKCAGYFPSQFLVTRADIAKLSAKEKLDYIHTGYTPAPIREKLRY